VSFDPQSEWGLRHRLRVAIRQGYSFDSLAIVLHVDAATLETYLSDPTYVLSSGDAVSIVEHLFDVEAPDVWYDRRPMTGGCIITYVESAYWTQDQVDSIMVPDHATAFKIHYMAPSDEHRPMSSPLYAIPDFDVSERVSALIGDDLARLICIVFYEYQDIEA
jgi:hypothetical protein